MDIYQIGDVLLFRENGKHVYDVTVVRRFKDGEGEQMVEFEITELAQDYLGTMKIGTKLTVPEDGFVGTFENPSE